ncbi:hypothetical protein [Leucobacter sp. M11]|uniref:hypothetical protein n=1 Tax=Leucobacter sp. M11 TaxID=2993565 RepID=UPI002D7FDE65|nr:hypothetical protein [Leucobacter sp. M11]MEB4615829.1 hypothetical protein [Leucobacter sp. M11]
MNTPQSKDAEAATAADSAGSPAAHPPATPARPRAADLTVGATIALMLYAILGVTAGSLLGSNLILALQHELSRDTAEALAATVTFPIIAIVFVSMLAIGFGALFTWLGGKWHRRWVTKRAAARALLPY